MLAKRFSGSVSPIELRRQSVYSLSPGVYNSGAAKLFKTVRQARMGASPNTKNWRAPTTPEKTRSISSCLKS
jgi:hypothetical protein